MNFMVKRLVFAAVIVLFSSLILTNTAAQNVTVNLSAAKQEIKGFGGMTHPVWISDLTESQVTTAFGNNDGQIGMTILRIHVDENSGNWSREVATAQKAVSLGATVFASPWNPPSNMTETVNGKKRLKYSMYGDYTNHLNSFISYMKQNGVNLYAISIQNEPDYAYDWTWWTATEIVNFLKQNAGTLQTRVMAPESFQYIKSMSDPILNDAQALANMDILGAHLYGTPVSNFPYPLFKQKGQGKELWMTEVYTDSQNDADLWPMALDVAYNIHNSMVEAEFNAYIWWYIRRSYGMIKDNGQVSKRGYCMAQYSKFIRPGYVRVDATKNPTTDVYVSAYKNDQKVVVVVVNRSTSSKTINLSLSGATTSTLTKYTTSGSKNVKNDGTVSNSNGTFSLSLDSQSVTTFVGNLGSVITPTPVMTPTQTPLATPTPNQNPIWSGGPYSLNGSSDYINVPAGLTGNLSDFSITCWVKLNTLNTWSRIFDFGNNTDIYMMLTPASGTTGYPFFAITTNSNSGEQAINGTSVLPTGSWQHLAVVKNGNTGILYINTQEVGRNTAMSLTPYDLGNTINNYIGRSQWSQDPYLNGDIAEFFIYNRALSTSEVAALGSIPPDSAGMLGDVNEDGTIDIIDALLIAQYSVGIMPTAFNPDNADVNCDGNIDIIDALLIAQYAVGLITSFSC